MKPYVLFILLLIISSYSWGDVKCVGDTSCSIMTAAAAESGLSLPIILGELDNNVVKVIEMNQNIALAHDLTRIIYTPNNLNGYTKISLGGHFVLGYDGVRTKVMDYPFVFEQNPGSTAPVLLVEWGDQKRRHILNFGFNLGQADYGLGIINYQTAQLLIRGGYGEVIRILGNEHISLSLLIGGSYAYSDISVKSLPDEGVTVNIITKYGQVKWTGDEKYTHNMHIFGVTGALVGKLQWKNFAISTDIGLTPVYISGHNSLSKVGTVGPFLGNSGFFHVGVETSSGINFFTLIPRLNITNEWEFIPGSAISVTYGPPLLDVFHKGALLFSYSF